ncbi:MAG: CDP-alcohol phosphatidyltransferase family protein [Muribaculaceae bacterium]|nr:CDP-alcohol phosphatidyltransferase family protein [Bacteroidales bacterium]MDY2734185.1 CDP-alcohol phosphatidyltransferase family protein [Muribaculaceae bacterium]MDY4649907.1 CDP-alcohol phosphatidyltransferase family protein [Muribaculaceae bacterium]MDY5387269.1 CDP-alcohol phosphatidyltransferase family protein [Muribaculaceae bacterium]
MSERSKFKRIRDGLQQAIYKVINPVVGTMVRVGITPNMVTTVGLLGNMAAAALLVYAGMTQGVDGPNYGIVTLAGVVIILSSLFDMLDGQVARLGGMVSKFGALYDSALDRYCELFTLGGVAFYLMSCDDMIGALLTFLALVGSMMVSYVRARAEALGANCSVGLMQRPERVVVTSIAVIAAGIAHLNLIIVIGMALIALLANITAIVRILHSRSKLINK